MLDPDTIDVIGNVLFGAAMLWALLAVASGRHVLPTGRD
jgi:hypothetical protein